MKPSILTMNPQPASSSCWAGHLVSAGLGAAVGVLLARNFFFSERKIKQEVEPGFVVGDPEFARTINQLFGPPLLDGNSVTPLSNGREIFPAMLRAIAEARRSITLENFVWAEGHVTKQFAEALVERARAGVKVH